MAFAVLGATEFGVDVNELEQRARAATQPPVGGSVDVTVQPAGQTPPAVVQPAPAARSFFTFPMAFGIGAVALYFLIRR